MIKKTLYFGNPAYLSLRNAQLIIRLPEVVDNDTLPEYFKQVSEVSKPIEDIGVIVLDHKQITITSGVENIKSLDPLLYSKLTHQKNIRIK